MSFGSLPHLKVMQDWPLIIIDEYDTPIQEGYSKAFYDEIISEALIVLDIKTF